jgi:hypothetical protein
MCDASQGRHVAPVNVMRALVGNGRVLFRGVPGKVAAMTEQELADLHQVFATYHRGRAKQAAISVVRQYHLDLAQRLADEAAQIPRRSAIVERIRGRERHHSWPTRQ